MNDLSAFGKSLQTSLSAAGAELSSVASSTGTELMNFGREIGRDGAELGAHMAQGANHMGTSIAAGTRQIGDSLNQLSRERVAWFFALSTVGTLMFSLAFFVGFYNGAKIVTSVIFVFEPVMRHAFARCSRRMRAEPAAAAGGDENRDARRRPRTPQVLRTRTAISPGRHRTWHTNV